MILSLLIPSIPERKHKLLKLLAELYKQILAIHKDHPTLDIVEILIDDSKKFLDGGLSIGEKRNALLQRASGKYLCFLDDDDEITPNYIEQLVRMCNAGKDIVTFRTLVKNDYYWALLDMSLINRINTEVNPEGIVERTPWHICPVLSELAKQEQFSNLNHNEDWDWMQRVLTRVKTEEHTDIILTQYNHSEMNSEADKIIRTEKLIPETPLLISLAVDGREKYTDKSVNLEKSVAKFWKGDARFYKHYPKDVTPHNVVPYKFKFDLIKKARQDGYKKIIWLDSSIRLAGDVLSLFGEEGVIAFHNLGHDLYKYISDKAVENLGVTEEELKEIPQTWGGAIGFDFNKDKAAEIFEEIYLHSLNGSFEDGVSSRPGFVAHRHDQAVMSVIFWKHKYSLLDYGWIVSSEHARSKEYGNYFKLIYGD